MNSICCASPPVGEKNRQQARVDRRSPTKVSGSDSLFQLEDNRVHLHTEREHQTEDRGEFARPTGETQVDRQRHRERTESGYGSFDVSRHKLHQTV